MYFVSIKFKSVYFIHSIVYSVLISIKDGYQNAYSVVPKPVGGVITSKNL